MLIRRKSLARVIAVTLTLLTMLAVFPQKANAQELYWDEDNAWEITNEETGYSAIIMDFADLFTSEEEDILFEQMNQVTGYGHAMVLTINDNSSSVEWLAQSYYEGILGRDSGCLFVVDMDNREIYIYTDGEVGDILSVNNCNTITDNVYRYAKDGDYYGCVYEGYYQINSLIRGQNIPRPMKYISNVLFAVIFALLLNFFLAKWMSTTRKASHKDIMNNIDNHYVFDNINVKHIRTEREYSPRSSDSGGSSGGGGGGHGGGHGF